MCSIMNLPLVVKHNFKPSKKLGEPSKLLHILGDGNCLFRAFSCVITGRKTYHMNVREQIINHMRDIETLLLPHMNTSLKGYLAKTKMAGNGVWGTDVEILTAASLLSADIFVYTKFGGAYKWQRFSRTMLDGKRPESDCSIYLNHTNGNHYDVVLDVSTNKSTQQTPQSSLSSDMCSFGAKKKRIGKNLQNVECQKKRKLDTAFPVSQKRLNKTAVYTIHSQCTAKASQRRNLSEVRNLKQSSSCCQETKVRPKQNATWKQENFPRKIDALDKLASRNVNNFHKSIDYTIYQCKICCGAWPQKSKKRKKTISNYVCTTCLRDKHHPKKFSKENFMIPSSVPEELQSLTQIEEMLIARALPLMRVYIKPGGQEVIQGTVSIFLKMWMN